MGCSQTAEPTEPASEKVKSDSVTANASTSKEEKKERKEVKIVVPSKATSSDEKRPETIDQNTDEEELLDIDNKDDDALTEFQTKMQTKISEHMENTQKLRSLRHEAFNKQFELFRRESKYQGLYDIWKKYSIDDEMKMDIDGLTAALKEFGMIIDTSRHLQQRVFDAFDLDKVGTIDYDDFNATMASIVASSTEDILYIVFMIFDLDDDGYLMLEDMARILLCLDQVAVVVTQHGKSNVKYTKLQTVKQAKIMMDKYESSEFTDNKISVDEFMEMMKNRTERDMMIDYMSQPSLEEVAYQTSILSSKAVTYHADSSDVTPVNSQPQEVITPFPSDKVQEYNNA